MSTKTTLADYVMSSRRELFDRILLNILANTYEHAESDVERDRASKAYKEYFGVDYEHFGSAIQQGVLGPPGHGKSSTYRGAAVMAAKLMGLKFVEANFESIPEDLEVDVNTFFFSNMYMAGKQSPTAITGMQVPDKESGSLVTFMPQPYKIAAKAGSSLIVFEDITAAPPQVQTALHLLFDDHVPSKELRKIYFGYTGNLGKIDKTAATEIMSSLATRVELHYTMMPASEYAMYVSENPRFTGSMLSDAMITGFIEMQGDQLFDSTETIGNQLNKKYSAPRSMDQFISSVRQELSIYLGRGGDKTPNLKSQIVNKVQLLAQNTVGLNKASELQSYYNMLLGSAYPIVQQVLANGDITPEITKTCKEIFGDGLSSEQIGFRHALLETASKLLGDKFARAYEAEIGLEDRPQVQLCGKALNSFLFATINDQAFRTTLVRKTTINMLRKLETKIDPQVLAEKVGKVSPENGLIMNPDISRMLAEDIGTRVKQGVSLPYAKSDTVMASYETFTQTNGQLRESQEQSFLAANV